MADGEAPAQDGQAAQAAPETPGQPPAAAGEQQQQPDVAEALASIERRFEGLASRLAAGGPDEEADFLSQLAGDGQEQGAGEEIQYVDEQGNPVDQHGNPLAGEQFADPDEQAFNQLLDERVNAAVAPIAQQFEMQRRSEGLNKLAEQFPDIRSDEVLDPLTEKLEGFAESYGDAVMTDPRFVELAYKAVKAEAAAAAETPAEAVGQGNSLETGAGPGAPATNESPEEAIAKALVGGGPSNDVVTGLGWGQRQ
jgi:hypothetical protein